MLTSNLTDDRYNQYIPRSLGKNHSLDNTAELARLWVQNSHKIDMILRQQPGEKITTSEGFEVKFSDIDYHTSYKTSHDYEMCFFPSNRYRSDTVEVPWFKYSRNYTYAVYDTRKDSTAQYAYDVMYEIITTLFRLIATYEVRTESVTVIENAIDRNHEWYRVNDGEYYLQLCTDNNDPNLYRYSDWECFTVDELIEITVIKSVCKCENPVDLDSAHFITINHNKDIEYRDNVYRYVSEVFTAVREDISITVEERVMIISEIQSIDSFNNARKSLKIKRKVFKHGVLTKAIEFERKSLDNILFGLYEKL